MVILTEQDADKIAAAIRKVIEDKIAVENKARELMEKDNRLIAIKTIAPEFVNKELDDFYKELDKDFADTIAPLNAALVLLMEGSKA